jgi:protease-4
MNNFFKMLFASCLGTLLALTVGVFLMVVIVGGIFAAFSSNKSEEVAEIETNSILHLKLNQPIAEQTQEDVDFSNFAKFSVSNQVGLYDMVRTIRAAKTNDKIKGIYLDLPPMTPNGMATLFEIRKAIEDFKTSKKFVYAFARGYSQGDYYLASVADSVFMHREGQLLFTGFASQSTYFKGMLDRLKSIINGCSVCRSMLVCMLLCGLWRNRIS